MIQNYEVIIVSKLRVKTSSAKFQWPLYSRLSVLYTIFIVKTSDFCKWLSCSVTKFPKNDFFSTYSRFRPWFFLRALPEGLQREADPHPVPLQPPLRHRRPIRLQEKGVPLRRRQGRPGWVSRTAQWGTIKVRPFFNPCHSFALICTTIYCSFHAFVIAI